MAVPTGAVPVSRSAARAEQSRGAAPELATGELSRQDAVAALDCRFAGFFCAAATRLDCGQSQCHLSTQSLAAPCRLVDHFTAPVVVLRLVLDDLARGHGLGLPKRQGQFKKGGEPPAASRLLDRDDDEDWKQWLLQFGEHVAWYSGLVVLSLQWDRPLHDKWPWHLIAIPFYVAVLVFRVAWQSRSLQKLRRALAAMVSREFLQREYGDLDWDNVEEEEDGDNDNGPEDRDNENSNEARRRRLLQKYIVVSTNPIAVAAVLEALSAAGQTVSDDEVEILRVETSEEYRAVAVALRKRRSAMGTAVVVYVTFTALCASKLDGQIGNASWWLIFLPFWISLGFPFLLHFLNCCCGGPPGHMMDDDDDDEEEAESKDGDEEAPSSLSPPTPPRATAKEDAVQASVKFASAEGDMEEFNRKVDSSDAYNHNFFTARSNDVRSVDDGYHRPCLRRRYRVWT